MSGPLHTTRWLRTKFREGETAKSPEEGYQRQNLGCRKKFERGGHKDNIS
jgi:hypothetical protein